MKKKQGAQGSHKADVLDELKGVFESAELTSPGFSEQFLRETLSRLLPSVSDSRIKSTVARMSRFV